MAVKDKKDPAALDRAMSYEEVAERMSVRPRQVQRWTEEGHLSYVRLPQGRRILESQLQAFIDSNRVEVGR